MEAALDILTDLWQPEAFDWMSPKQPVSAHLNYGPLHHNPSVSPESSPSHLSGFHNKTVKKWSEAGHWAQAGCYCTDRNEPVLLFVLTWIQRSVFQDFSLQHGDSSRPRRLEFQSAGNTSCGSGTLRGRVGLQNWVLYSTLMQRKCGCRTASVHRGRKNTQN